MVHVPGSLQPATLNASGRAGRGVDAEGLRSAGHSVVPLSHPDAVTVPGCVAGWAELAERFGRLGLAAALQPAIRYATEGFPASTELSTALTRWEETLAPQSAAQGLYPTGKPPGPDDRVTRPDLAVTLADIAAGGPQAFYEGRPGRAISAATGGRITPDDLAREHCNWVDPLSLDVFGVTGWTVPPNSQGFAILAAAWLFERLDPPRDPDHPDFWHLLIEAYRAVAWELADVVADPDFAPGPPGDLLDHHRLADRLDSIDYRTVAEWPERDSRPGGTAYLCVVDQTGMGVSLIQSNYTGFGGGIGAEGVGFFLHDRGAGFDLRAGHPNELAPGKRPFHTLSPTLWTQEGTLRLLLGTRGGSYQPQILLQMAAHLLGRRASPAEAQARPRWVIDAGPDLVRMEASAGERTARALAAKGHRVQLEGPLEEGWGPVSLITVDRSGLRTGAADPRVATATAAVRRPPSPGYHPDP